MTIATEVHQIMESFLEERGHQKDLEASWVICNGYTWFFGLGEIQRKVRNDAWYDNCRPLIRLRRDLLTGNNGFRNALEVALQLRSMRKGSTEIRKKMLDVHCALSAVMDVTDAQLDELLTYDRKFGQGD